MSIHLLELQEPPENEAQVVAIGRSPTRPSDLDAPRFAEAFLASRGQHADGEPVWQVSFGDEAVASTMEICRGVAATDPELLAVLGINLMGRAARCEQGIVNPEVLRRASTAFPGGVTLSGGHLPNPAPAARSLRPGMLASEASLERSPRRAPALFLQELLFDADEELRSRRGREDPASRESVSD
jgi:hypothetical protein